MKQLKMTALAIALSTAAASSVMAQSAKTNAWEGFYGQLGVGYESFTPSNSSGTVSVNSAPSLGSIGNTSQTANNANGLTSSISAGYNFGVDTNYVVGLGVSYYPGASSSATTSSAYTPTLAIPGNVANTTPGSYNVKNVYSIFLAPGYAIDKDSLVYVKIGYVGATVGSSSPIIPYTTANLTGINYGLGYKQMVTTSVYAFGEANFANFGSKNVSVAGAGAAQGLTLNTSVKGSGMDFLVGLGYRF